MKSNKALSALMLISFLFGFFFGFSCGLIYIGHQISNTLDKIYIKNIEIGFNETYVMDRFNETISQQIKEGKA